MKNIIKMSLFLALCSIGAVHGSSSPVPLDTPPSNYTHTTVELPAIQAASLQVNIAPGTPQEFFQHTNRTTLLRQALRNRVAQAAMVNLTQE